MSLEVRMVCKTCGQEDGRPAEALLRAELVDARREIGKLRGQTEHLRRLVLDAFDDPHLNHRNAWMEEVRDLLGTGEPS